jgi:hypothetical protein
LRALGEPIVTDVIQHFRDLVRRDQLDTALRAMFEFVREMEANAAFSGKPFPFPLLDDVCEEIGSVSAFELLAAKRPSIDADHDLVLMTETVAQGGHAEIVRDLADLGERPLVIVATNLHDRKIALLPELADHPRVLGVVELNDRTLLARLRAAQALIANPAAHRVLVMCHGPDPVAIAAAAPVDNKPVLFFHHCDHTPALGSFMKHAFHIDLHNLAFEQCRIHLGIDTGYVCMTSREGKVCRAQGRYAEPTFKSATCGSEGKLTTLRYPIPYSDVVVRLIRARGGLHFHVGSLSDEFVNAIQDALDEARLPRQSFIHVGHVNGFREIIEALEIDLYLPTLPQAGGKALIDAMSAGVPILVHENAIDRLWGGRDLVYPTAPSWSTLLELEDRLELFGDAGYWRDQTMASRAYFEKYHANALFVRMLRANGRLPEAIPPPLKPYRPGLNERLKTHAMTSDRGGGT